MVAKIRRELRRLPAIAPDLARLTGPTRAIIASMKGTDATQNAERFKLGRILVRGQDRVEKGHYLTWCRHLGLQPRTAQNYTRMWRSLGARYDAFCSLNTATIYRLSRASDEVATAALDAAKKGPMTAEAAALLLSSDKKPIRPEPASPETRRAIAILETLDVESRVELIGLLPRIDLAAVRARLAPRGDAQRVER